jgi:hypothetical protein
MSCDHPKHKDAKAHESDLTTEKTEGTETTGWKWISNLRFEISDWKWRGTACGLIVFVLGILWIARSAAAVPQTAESRPAAVGVGGGGVFVPVEVYVDSGGSELGAYQVEVTAKNAMIVGLEGGETKAFSSAPYYDPAALQGNRIVVASFSTDETLPKGMTRVARLHMMLSGAVGADGLPEMTSKLVVATDGQGKTLDAKLMLKPMQGDK